MIRMQTEQLWDMIYQDKKLKQKLEEQLKEIKAKRERCYQLFLEQLEIVQKLREQVEISAKKIKRYEDNITKFHQQISMIEIRIILAENKLKKLKKDYQNCSDKKEQAELLYKIREVEDKIRNYQSSQDDLRDKILDEEKKKARETAKKKTNKERVLESEHILDTRKRNVVEWDVELETKQNLFYHQTFEALNEDHKLLQEFVARNIEDKKRLTKPEAKKNTDAVIFDDETISIDPPGKVRRLTKEEKEKLHQVEEL